jgi:integrase
MKHLINTFNELTPEEKADFIKFYTGGDGNLTDEEKRELESGDTTSIICTAFDIWVAKNLDGGKLIDTFVKKAYEFDLADSGYPDSAKERATAKLNAALDIMNAKYFMDIRKKLNPAEEQEYNEILDMARNAKLRDGSWEEYKARKSGKIVPTTFIPQPATAYQEPAKPKTPHQISEMMRYMFEVSQIKPETRKSQEYDVKSIVGSIGLTMDDDYSKMNDPKMIDKICTWIKERKNRNGTDISNKRKNKQLGILRSLITAANRKEPTQYKLTELTNCIMFLRKDTKGQTKEYWPFNDAQLADIFDPKHDFFKENPEQFLACLIAMFSGARTNAAVSLQFGDIIKEDGIDVIAFFENHERKHLKNDATERYLPIAKQLIDWGFVDMIRERQKKIGAKDTDFIFARTQHDVSGDPADKFMTPFINTFMRKKLKIVDTGRKKYTFHSFRDTVSNKMEDCGINNTMAKKLVGWKDGDIRYTHYTKRDCIEWKKEIDKLVYPEELLHLEEWKKIIPQLYLDRKDAPLKRPNQIPD